MNQELLRLLSSVTEEEKKLLQGNHAVEPRIYAKGSYPSVSFTIDSGKMLAKGRLMDIRPHTRFAFFPNHRHNYIEVIYMCAGQTTHIINKETRLTLSSGDLLFLNLNTFHEILPAGMGDIAVNFIILPQFFDTALTMLPKGNILSDFLASTLRRDSSQPSYLHFQVADILPVQNLIENMVWSTVYRQPNQYRVNQLTMALLFLQLLNYTGRVVQSAPPGLEQTLVANALREIEENYKTASLTRLAKQYNQSVSHYSRLISSAAGASFKELLRQKRLDKAAALLLSTDLSVSDIITAVGYDNTSYFYRQFRQSFGLTPKDYRQSRKTEKTDSPS